MDKEQLERAAEREMDVLCKQLKERDTEVESLRAVVAERDKEIENLARPTNYEIQLRERSERCL